MKKRLFTTVLAVTMALAVNATAFAAVNPTRWRKSPAYIFDGNSDKWSEYNTVGIFMVG